MAGTTITRELLEEYITDEELIGHILFFESVFPNYEIFTDEMLAEGNRVIVRGRLKGQHEGEFNGILPTHRQVEFPLVISYQIENGKIVHHWLMADSMALMEQLGVMNAPA
jgi:predicted ester cyclase